MREDQLIAFMKRKLIGYPTGSKDSFQNQIRGALHMLSGGEEAKGEAGQDYTERERTMENALLEAIGFLGSFDHRKLGDPDYRASAIMAVALLTPNVPTPLWDEEIIIPVLRRTAIYTFYKEELFDKNPRIAKAFALIDAEAKRREQAGEGEILPEEQKAPFWERPSFGETALRILDGWLNPEFDPRIIPPKGSRRRL